MECEGCQIKNQFDLMLESLSTIENMKPLLMQLSKDESVFLLNTKLAASEQALAAEREKREQAEAKLKAAYEFADKQNSLAYEWYLRHAWYGIDVDDYCEELGEKCSDIMKDSAYQDWRAEQAEARLSDYNSLKADFSFACNENQQLRQRVIEAEAQAAAMRNCWNCKKYDQAFDNDGEWLKNCEHDKRKTKRECVDQSHWEGDLSAASALLAEHNRYKDLINNVALLLENPTTDKEEIGVYLTKYLLKDISAIVKEPTRAPAD